MSRMLEEVLRKLRGAAGTAGTWGLVWALLSVVPAVILIVALPDVRFDVWELIRGFAMLFGGAGVVSGGLFSALLGTVYRRHRLADLRPARVGLWGGVAAGAMGFAGLWGLASLGAVLDAPVGLAVVLTVAGLGWGTAALTVRLARGAESRLGEGDAVDAIGSGE